MDCVYAHMYTHVYTIICYSCRVLKVYVIMYYIYMYMYVYIHSLCTCTFVFRMRDCKRRWRDFSWSCRRAEVEERPPHPTSWLDLAPLLQRTRSVCMQCVNCVYIIILRTCMCKLYMYMYIHVYIFYMQKVKLLTFIALVSIGVALASWLA